MKLAVIQHLLRDSVAADRESLADEVTMACAAGADVVVVPRIDAVQDGAGIAADFLARVAAGAGCAALLVPFAWGEPGAQVSLTAPTPLGQTALLNGDEALDPDVLAGLTSITAHATILRPAAESALQAEAFIELALAMSDSMVGVVAIAEPIGPLAEPRAFGGSCIASVGELIAEAEAEDASEILFADLRAPVVLGIDRPPMPPMPGILVQRWAHHRGRRPDPGYLADLR